MNPPALGSQSQGLQTGFQTGKCVRLISIAHEGNFLLEERLLPLRL